MLFRSNDLRVALEMEWLKSGTFLIRARCGELRHIAVSSKAWLGQEIASYCPAVAIKLLSVLPCHDEHFLSAKSVY